ncbi:MAG: hypothetical protein E6G94_01415 [Alphaproteobacteria bacterium]|nr:MAG: hypothetical protein E6G94_01415 [Alphaproteobacteria bacterium]
MNPFQALADIAASQLGTQEDAKHTNAGAAIAKYQHDTNLGGQGWPWCAAFVDWCVHQFLLVPANAAICAIPLANRPRTAAAFGLRTWGLDNNCRIFHPNNKDSHGLAPLAGDLVVFAFSHCGIVSRNVDAHHFEAIEGNSNNDGSRDGYAVVRKVRDITRVLCFVRLPVRAQRA